MTVHGSWSLDRLVEAYTQHQRRTRGLRTSDSARPRPAPCR